MRVNVLHSDGNKCVYYKGQRALFFRTIDHLCGMATVFKVNDKAFGICSALRFKASPTNFAGH